ncbi:hypothetical protein CAEBREN_20052 [Caenorhabditis brenneri]|uniref:Uncharacterized protein n=1 Tax=Caenorhabditis brenneri TaxID=135651 RepID=G0N263_CAEBE|nr:hypothetical protein CAEBREN_20052 [Caenorhabditis brenneri]
MVSAQAAQKAEAPQKAPAQAQDPQDDGSTTMTSQELALKAQEAELQALLDATPTVKRLNDEREKVGRRIARTELELRNLVWKGAESQKGAESSSQKRAELQKELWELRESIREKYGPDEELKCYTKRQELEWKLRDVRRELKVWNNARIKNITYEKAAADQKRRDKSKANEKERKRVKRARAFIDKWLGRPAVDYSNQEGSEAWEKWYAQLSNPYVE